MNAEAIGREFQASTHPIGLHVENVEAARRLNKHPVGVDGTTLWN